MTTLAFAAFNKNKKILNTSSSGGVFYAIANYIISNLGGVVYGVVLDGSFAHHARATKDNYDLFLKMLGSKYVQSSVGDCFKQCEKDLNDDRYVMFTGTPCQIYALKTYLAIRKISTNKLIACDNVCHGVPQQKYLAKYLAEKFPGEIVSSVNFRKKKPSWEYFSIEIITNKRRYSKPFWEDEYGVAFLKNYTLIHSCFSCRYKSDNRASDIVFADFWGVENFYPEYYNKKGTSLLLIRNKAEFLLPILEKCCILNEVNLTLSTFQNSAYYLSVNKPSDYQIFLQSQPKESFIDFFSTYIAKKDAFRNLKMAIKKTIKKVLTRHFVIPSNEKCVGIVTDYSYLNRGNRLQNYALSYVLKSQGFRPINIVRSNEINIKLFRFFRLLKTFFCNHKSFLNERSIKKACLKTGEQNIGFNYSLDSKKNISYMKGIVLGSDQIWNWQYNANYLPINLGMFAIKNSPDTFSYAASFGVDYIDINFIYLFQGLLGLLKSIGVREIAGVEMVKGMSYKATLNIDPTLLLSKRDWQISVSKFKTLKAIKKPYILKYCLGDSCEIPSLFRDEQAGINDCLQIDVSNKKSRYYRSNHFDLVFLIENSECVVTNSFHALVFALIFSKKICIIPRKGMESRIVSLLKLVGLEYKPREIIDLSLADFAAVDALRKDSYNYIAKNLKSDE